MMIYTIHCDGKKQTFEGFRRCSGNKPLEAKYLGGVLYEDTWEFFWLENKGLAVEELQRLFRTDFQVEVEVILFQEV